MEKQFGKRCPRENNENQENFKQKGLELGTSQTNSCDIAAHILLDKNSFGPYANKM
jgi:hypothetical protein